MAVTATAERQARLPASPAAARRLPGFAIAAGLAALACAGPALAVLAMSVTTAPALDAASLRLMRDAISGTLLLLALGGGGAVVIGVGAAALVSAFSFPGRGILSWALAAPLAAPIYVLAYGYSALTWAGGPIPLPVRGLTGAAFIYALACYPYVYLAARAAFATQSSCALEAARTLGASPWRAVLRAGLPAAYPGIIAGAALAGMEIAADYGAAQHFGVTTITTAIFRARFSQDAPHLALHLASVLLIAAFVLLWVERMARGRRGYAGGSARWRPLALHAPPPAAAWAMTAACCAIVALGAILPLGWLARLVSLRPLDDFAALAAPVWNSLTLASLGAAATLGFAAIAAASARTRSTLGRAAFLASGAGYAAPGVVIALGAMSVYALARGAGLVGGLGAGLSFALLVWTYAARFTAAGAQPIESGLVRVTKNIAGAARTLGADPLNRFWRVDLPIAAPSAAAGALIVFVEILKELPATLILRPANFDTLAIRAYAYASDERLTQAAAPALILTLAGLIPIFLFTRNILRLRAGAA
ncbi:MAG: ABC transporter permease subunit [Alphaproteobacteria bacterium]|nr:ABC transporter permease subunit [Alphaproteobacteria bacterium]